MPARTTKPQSYLRGRRLRATLLDSCFRPVYGDGSQVVTKGFVSVANTAQTSDSTEVKVTNANGDVCLFDPSVPSLTGYSVDIEFCEVDPEAFSLITGQEVYLDAAGNAIGFTVGTDIDISESRFSLELWLGTKASDVCADPNAQGNYGYLLEPALQGGVISDFTVQDGEVNFKITGAKTVDGNQWGQGPYDVMMVSGVPAPLYTAINSKKHVLLIGTTVAPPDPFAGSRPLLDPTNTALTAIAAAEGAGPTEAHITFTGPTTDPVWVDFGDGTWDYVEPASGGATHTYATNGDFTIKASSTTSPYAATGAVSHVVTIPFP